MSSDFHSPVNNLPLPAMGRTPGRAVAALTLITIRNEYTSVITP
jgi:hypothetical protein